MIKNFNILIIFFIGTISYSQNAYKFSSKDYVSALKKVTDVMVNDVTSPVAAARYYSYVTLASNEVNAFYQIPKNTFTQSFRQYNKIQVSDTLVAKSNASFSTIYCVFKMAEKLLPSGYRFTAVADSLTNSAIKKGISKEEVDNSTKLVQVAVSQMMDYVKADGFSKFSSYKRYTPTEGDGYWQPTGPGYMAALEPNWNHLRTFLLDSCRQFKPEPPAPFNLEKTSSYYKQLYEVYTVVNKLSKKQRAIASFWDCNPFILNQIGHVEFGLKKISPGGHWMGITGISCLKKETSLSQTAFIHMVVAVTLSDAFVSCWDEKYRSNRIRPETAINKWVDKRWKSVLQTPPFPEYTSGHSVISTAAATVLTQLLGDNFSFTDGTELEFGLPERKFRSFLEASQEAAISRLYGGIHYRDAIENGVIQGEKIGKYVVDKLLQSKIMETNF